jgi:hypothetical protein
VADSEPFDWSDRNALAVRRVDPIAVYTDADGDIVIRQQRAHEHADSLITVQPAHAYALIEAVQRQLRGPAPAVAATPLLTEFALSLARPST